VADERLDIDMVELGRERLRALKEVPGVVRENNELKRQLAELRVAGQNNPQYRDLQRRCCDACNENADLRKLVGELRAEIAALKGGGFPPPGYDVPKPVYEE
jgi:hypothetical protein